MDSDIAAFCKSCLNCAHVKGSAHMYINKLQLFPATSFNEMIAIDLVGALPVSFDGNKYILTMIDKFTRYCKLKPIPNMKSITVNKALIEAWFIDKDIHQNILSDRGKPFTGSMMQSLSHTFGFKNKYTVAYTPSTNGIIERLHKDAKQQLCSI